MGCDLCMLCRFAIEKTNDKLDNFGLWRHALMSHDFSLLVLFFLIRYPGAGCLMYLAKRFRKIIDYRWANTFISLVVDSDSVHPEIVTMLTISPFRLAGTLVGSVMGVMGAEDTQTISARSSSELGSLLGVRELLSDVIWATTSQIWLNFVEFEAVLISSDGESGWLLGWIKAIGWDWLIEVDEVKVEGW